MVEQIGELFMTVVGMIIIVGLARFAWAIGGQLAQYAMSNISPSPEVTIHRGYAGTKCFEYIRDDWGRLVWVGRLPEHDREPDDGT